MPFYKRLKPLPSGGRASYPQGPADPNALSDLLATPSLAQSGHFSADDYASSLRSEGERAAPSYLGQIESFSTNDVRTYPSPGHDNHSSTYTGNDIDTFANVLPDDEHKSSELRNASTVYEPSKGRERPKAAIRSGLRANLLTLLPHLIAAVATFGVISLSFRGIYWMDLVPPERLIAPLLTQSGALNALQFAPKIHELLILASLTTIVMFVMRVHLLGPAGLPFGLVASGFQIFSGEWLRRKSFWASWKAGQSSGTHFSRYPYVPFLILLIISSLLATLTGPSSAIAIVPTLNWFPLPQPFNTTVLPFFVYNRSTELWPATVTAANLNSADSGNNCTFALNTHDEACPSGGFRDLYSWSRNLLFLEPKKGTNVSFQNDRGETRRVVSCQSCAGPATGKASAISLNSFLTGALTTFWTYAGNTYSGEALKAAQPKISPSLNTEIFGPRVHTVCDTFKFNRSDTSNLANMAFPKLTQDPSIDPKLLHVPKWTWDYPRRLNSSNFTWVEIPKTPGGPSIGGVFTVPVTEREPEAGSPLFQSSELVVCSVY